MSQMMQDPGVTPPPDPGMAGQGPGPGPDMGGGGGLPPALVAALSGGGGQNSPDLMAQGPLAGQSADEADQQTGDDPLSMVRDAIDLLRKAGAAETDDQRSHQIDKVQAELQKILATESQKTDKLRQALGG